jgi:addiction module RelE/StbE family toxin
LARLIYTANALADLARLTDFLLESDPTAALHTIELIEEAVSILQRHPLVGRPVDQSLRELVISRGHSGYVALYSHEEIEDCILILAVRHQREAGYESSQI